MIGLLVSREGFMGIYWCQPCWLQGFAQEKWGGGYSMKGSIVSKDHEGRRSKRSLS